VSEPKRYAWKVNEENDFDLIEHSKGEFVRYEDYAILKAEVDAIRKDRDLMFKEIKEGREAYQRLHHLYLTAKEGKSQP